MRIAESFRRLFKGHTVNVTTLQGEPLETKISYDAGDILELNRWLEQNQKSSNKYPLVWYPIQPYRVDGKWLEADGGLIIFTKTKMNTMNKQRAEDTYENTLYPTWESILKKLERNSYFEFLYDTNNFKDAYELDPKPLYGDKNSFDSTGESGALIDIVDALFINFKFKIKHNCI